MNKSTQGFGTAGAADAMPRGGMGSSAGTEEMPTGRMIAEPAGEGMPMGGMLSGSAEASGDSQPQGYGAGAEEDMPSGRMSDGESGEMPTGAMPTANGNSEAWNMDLASPQHSCGC